MVAVKGPLSGEVNVATSPLNAVPSVGAIVEPVAVVIDNSARFSRTSNRG
jgi:hypothetical protein